ncbi:MAG: SpoIID/LytB domain-containing protein [Brevinematia bacterium]
MYIIRHIILSFAIILLITVVFSCIPRSNLVYTDFTELWSNGIRVLIGKSNAFKIISKGNLIFINGIPFGSEVNVRLTNNGIFVNDISVGTNVEVFSDGNMIFDGIEYRGFFRLIAKQKYIFVVNVVNLEDYLESVVPSEVPALWPMEVLKAQAIVSRTYALRKMIENKNKDYDVFASYKSQVYSGTKRIHPRSSRAVRETEGIVILHSNEIINAFFHANSGGLIESPEIIGINSVPYLKPSIDKFSKETFRSYWTLVISQDEFLKNVFGVKNLRLVHINIPNRMSSGSVKVIEIVATDGKVNKTNFLKIDKFREIFPSILSPKFEVEIKGKDIFFRGYGWGHGVGMSQWGAREMSLQGYNYREIIKYYYKDVELSKLY